MSLRVWNGSSWAYAAPKVWNGGSWAPANNAYVWNGSSWVRFYPNLKYSGTVNLIYDSDYTTYEEYVFWNGVYGSASPNTLVDGKTFNLLMTYYNNYGPSYFGYNVIQISGFSSDPGASYLKEIKIGSTTYDLSGALYGYSGGVAEWDDVSGPWFTYPGSFSVQLYGT